MKFTVQDVQFKPNSEPVTIVLSHSFGLSNVNTTQTLLTQRAAAGANWGDEQVLAAAQAAVDGMPDGPHTVELMTPPTPAPVT